MMPDIPVIPTILLGAGGYLAWFGVHYWRSDVAWPSDPVKAILQGKGLPAASHSGESAVISKVASISAPATGGTQPGVQGSGLPSAGTYTHAQLMELWQQAGGSAASANNAACHAIQESGGNPQATSQNPDGGENVGLWQLDTKGVGAGYSVQELMNAQNNARITVFATVNGTNWSQWSTPGC